VVAFGTSAPELAVGIASGITATNSLTLGNIIGSSMSNIALIVGLAAFIFPLQVKDTVVRREIPMLLATQVGLGLLMFLDGELSRMDGLILLLGFIGFMVYVTLDARQSMRIRIDIQGDIDTDGDGNGLPREGAARKEAGLVWLWIFCILSLAGLFIGGKLTVDSSTQIAQSLGLSETLIGLTVVALATTMPELITSIMAARKKEPEIVLGNCIGSNLFNILFVLGASSAISPIAVEGKLLTDTIAMTSLTLILLGTSVLHKQIRRYMGVLLLLIYIGYLSYQVLVALKLV